jgi:hypothetical protein
MGIIRPAAGVYQRQRRKRVLFASSDSNMFIYLGVASSFFELRPDQSRVREKFKSGQRNCAFGSIKYAAEEEQEEGGCQSQGGACRRR